MPDPFDPYDYELHREGFFAGVHNYVIDEEEDEDEEEEEEDEEYIPVVGSPRVSQDGLSTSEQTRSFHEVFENGDEEEGNKRRRIEGGEACSSNGIGSVQSSQGNEWNRGEIDGLFCPICMDAWTNDGDHHICCLPCGHLYGMSCIKRWLQQRKNSGKCPQCNRKCTLKDVRKIFAPRVVAVDEESLKRIRSLEAKCDSLEKKGADWCKKEAEWKNKEAELDLKVQKYMERTTYLEHLLGDRQSRRSGIVNAWDCQLKPTSEDIFVPKVYRQRSSCSFKLQEVLQLDGARLFDIDTSSQILLIARRPSRMGGMYLLSKLSLIHPYEMEDILLPSNTSAIKDLHVSPANGSLALFSSLGKKLSVLSMESNNVVLAYDLKTPAWSCSWDLSNSHYIYAGLQNGSLLAFDIRQTMGPLKTFNGLTCNPVHSLQSLVQDSTLPSGVRTVLSASAIGPCQWNFGGAEQGPYLVPETENRGVCISLAYCPSSDDIVASYRPKVDMTGDILVSQPSLTPFQINGQGIQGSHVSFKRMGSNFQQLGSTCANVSDVRLPKSAIIDTESGSRFFASGDEVTSELILQELPSFTVLQHFKSSEHPMRDLKYSHALGVGLLGCLSESSLQLFSTKLS
ncbi:E3 ubiquitin-protein ligase RFWD3 [Quillaja saponaria]|uniref:RING-type E3 ubiquitin transferase n=1 Tax=Quillaja saponaria TaxID=32244 RepID=A0AAD7Q900_QUISA|nr:E3 ubiquitin-protein ligase RFWD3 [Quillaja saponaria]